MKTTNITSNFFVWKKCSYTFDRIDNAIMRTRIKNFIKEIMPITVLYAFIKLVFHTSHIQTFIIVVILLVAITKALDFIATLLDAEIGRQRNE
jgi:hypothetical protein